ncbi:unnamed protein product [Pylaiella littoralis]
MMGDSVHWIWRRRDSVMDVPHPRHSAFGLLLLVSAFGPCFDTLHLLWCLFPARSIIQRAFPTSACVDEVPSSPHNP